jgi:glycosyltransferase involved in cell wall biosynthesis
LKLDCVYFLMFRGWSQELQANRWQWAKRWAVEAPVVLVQPVQPRASTTLNSVLEPRLPNTRILYVQSQDRGAARASGAIAAGQIAADLAAQGYSRPLLWCYNPRLREAYASLPAVARVYHATENHFRMDGLDDVFREELRATIGLSDLAVAVSSGVASSISVEVPGARVETITNGCDFGMYADPEADEELVATAAGRRVFVYAGNINARLDYGLLAQAARAHQDCLLAVFGPVSGLDRADLRAWKELRRVQNVSHFGVVEPERLPGLYAAADVGLLPYKTTPFLVENGFPLKTLEMAATGLPVVSTPLDPLRQLARGIDVTGGGDEFVRALASGRAQLPKGDRDELVELARRNDYDVKFESVCEVVAEVSHPPEPVPLEPLVAAWQERAVPPAAAWAIASGERLRLAFSRLAATLVPEAIRERVPSRFRGVVNRLLNPR